MDRVAIIARLRANEAALRARGVLHAALFGSRARGEGRPDSDTDILIDLDPEAPITLFDYVGLKQEIADLFEGKVDVVHREGLKPHLRRSTVSDAVYAF
jgi:predicted nucleotidyltransferase